MKIIGNTKEVQKTVQGWKEDGEKVGFVPTMGALHEGHLSLIRKCEKENDSTVVSIFVNPTQFNDPKDFEKYPRTLEKDIELCMNEGVELLYIPQVNDIYGEVVPKMNIHIPHLMNGLCGRTRPGHFEGVLLIVGNLFHIVNPDIAYFGLKDFQQYTIINYFTNALRFPIKIKGVQTIREEDGLAMSSRNVRLNPEMREAASLIPKAYHSIKNMVRRDENVQTIIKKMTDVLMSNPLNQIDYIEAVEPETLQPIQKIDNDFVLALAVFIKDVRLIDNQLIQVK